MQKKWLHTIAVPFSILGVTQMRQVTLNMLKRKQKWQERDQIHCILPMNSTVLVLSNYFDYARRKKIPAQWPFNYKTCLWFLTDNYFNCQ